MFPFERKKKRSFSLRVFHFCLCLFLLFNSLYLGSLMRFLFLHYFLSSSVFLRFCLYYFSALLLQLCLCVFFFFFFLLLLLFLCLPASDWVSERIDACVVCCSKQALGWSLPFHTDEMVLHSTLQMRLANRLVVKTNSVQ